jgi:hypothetical protein
LRRLRAGIPGQQGIQKERAPDFAQVASGQRTKEAS